MLKDPAYSVVTTDWTSSFVQLTGLVPCFASAERSVGLLSRYISIWLTCTAQYHHKICYGCEVPRSAGKAGGLTSQGNDVGLLLARGGVLHHAIHALHTILNTPIQPIAATNGTTWSWTVPDLHQCSVLSAQALQTTPMQP